jgi:hypothetical protein
MIAKGTVHNNGARLAQYMTTGKGDERAELWHMRGFAENNLVDAFRTVQAMAEGTKCENPMFHVQVRNPEGETLTRAQWERTADRLEAKLGLSGQPRAIAFHIDTKTGHEHMHVAWSRIDEETMTAKPLPYFKLRLKETCRELEKEFGITQVRNEREGPIMAPKRAEEEQARRNGVDLKTVRQTIRDCFEKSDSGKAFAASLAERGLILTVGNERDFVVIDAKGGPHALGKRLLGITVHETNERLADLDRTTMPIADQVIAQFKARQAKPDHENAPMPGQDRDATPDKDADRAAEREARRLAYIEARAEKLAPHETVKAIGHAWATTETGPAFVAALEARDILVARVTADEARESQHKQEAAKSRGGFKPAYEAGDTVAIDRRGNIFALDRTTIMDHAESIAARLAEIDTGTSLTLTQGKQVMDFWRGEREPEEVDRSHAHEPGIAAQAFGVVSHVVGGIMHAGEMVLSSLGNVLDYLFGGSPQRPTRPAPGLTPTRVEAPLAQTVAQRTLRNVDREAVLSDPHYKNMAQTFTPDDDLRADIRRRAEAIAAKQRENWDERDR